MYSQDVSSSNGETASINIYIYYMYNCIYIYIHIPDSVMYIYAATIYIYSC